MNANVKVGSEHPHFVHIPDPQSEGVRTYREPDEPHPLQLLFLDSTAEGVWVTEIAGLLAANRADEALARLNAELASFDGRLARLCKTIAADSVELEGWSDLLPILSEWEGPPITGITLGLTNPADLVFDAGGAPDPELLIGLYSDEGFPFSTSTNADILAECGKELPEWVGGEEDVEFYCALTGLAELNGALINCKHRHYLRDGRDGVEGRAPGGYVEYVLACWFLAAQFLQAVNRANASHGTAEGCRMVVGSVDINADFVTVIGKERRGSGKPAASSEPAFAALTVKPWAPRPELAIEALEVRSALRQRIRTAEAEAAASPSPGLLSRLFRRLRQN